MRQSLSGYGLALRRALDNAFRRRLKVQVLGYQPFDERGKLRVPEAFPPSYVDGALDCPAGHVSAVRRRWPSCLFYLRALVIRSNGATDQPDC